MGFIKKIITLTLCVSLNLCIFPVAASNSNSLDLSADPITPSNTTCYKFEVAFPNDVYEWVIDGVDVSNLPTNDNTCYETKYNWGQAAIAFHNQYSYTEAIRTTIATGSIYVSGLGAYFTTEEILGSGLKRWNALLQVSPTYFFVYDPAEITEIVVNCPTDYGLHSDNFCYPLTEVYDPNNQICEEYAQTNLDYIIQGIWDSIIPEQILIKIPEVNLYCVADAQYELLSGNQNSTIKQTVYENRVTSQNYLGEIVRCVDVYYAPLAIGVYSANYLAHPQSYPVANIAPSSVFCDPNNTTDVPNTDLEYLDNPIDKKCLNDFDCDGLTDGVDPDIDNDGILNNADLDDDNDGILDVDDQNPWDDDNDNDGFKDGDSRDTDSGSGENNDLNDGYVDIEDCDISSDPDCQIQLPDGSVNCVGDLVDLDHDGICGDEDFDDNNPLCQFDVDGDGLCNDVDFDDNNPLCQVDADGDGVCNDVDVDDNDPHKSLDILLESSKICDELYPVIDESNEYDYVYCIFSNKVTIRFKEFSDSIQSSGMLQATDGIAEAGMISNVDNTNGVINVSSSSSSRSCPVFPVLEFTMSGESYDLGSGFDLCSDGMYLFYDLMYWFIISSAVLYMILNIFRRS